MKNKYWFVPKLYGWGFCPITREGWLSTLAVVFLIILSAYTNNFFNCQVEPENGFRFLLDIIFIACIFTALFKDKVRGGLRWQWGRKK